MIRNYYTDGAATMRKIDGEYVREAGGWAFILLDENMKELNRLNGGEEATTNNRMELMAIFMALNDAEYEARFNEEPTIVNIYSDSAYCINIFTQWIEGWIKRGWKKADKKPIENLDLIQRIWSKMNEITAHSFNTITFIKVKGHDNVHWNEEADKFAVAAKEAIQEGNK